MTWLLVFVLLVGPVGNQQAEEVVFQRTYTSLEICEGDKRYYGKRYEQKGKRVLSSQCVAVRGDL